MLNSMRVRMTVAFVALLAVFGWFLVLAISHSSDLMKVYDHAGQQHHIRMALTTFMWILFPAVAIGAWVIVGRTLRPLRALSRQAEEPNAVRLVSPSSDVEMTELVSTINHLLNRIESTAEAKAQFYAAASHELRTPLQALNGHIETALSKDRAEGEYRLALVEAQKQTQRLTTLTRDILMLHQLQAQRPDIKEQCDLYKSISVALNELSPLIEARGLLISTDIPVSLALTGRQSYADICVRNLLENAARYASEGSQISVTLTPSELQIVNDCDLPTTVDLEKFFEPFAASKGVGHSSSGNGLGLAVCRAAAQANNWSVHLSRDKGTVTARVSFSG